MKSFFKRLEILGNVDLLREAGFFEKFIIDGCFNVEELILDSILMQEQLADMAKGLKCILDGPVTESDLPRFNNHKLKRITFVKPQEYSEEI